MECIVQSSLKQLIVLFSLVCMSFLNTTDRAWADSQTIKMAYQEFEPFSYTGTDGSPHGYAIDLMEHLARSQGYETSFVPAGTSVESMRTIQAGEADVSALLAFTPDRLTHALPTTELGSFEMRAFVLKQHVAFAPDDLAGRNVGVVTGSYTVTAAQLIKSAQFIEYADRDSMMIALLAGDVDAVVSANASFMKRLRQANVEQYVRAIDPPLTSTAYGFFVVPTRPDIQSALDNAIETHLTKEYLNQLNEVWFGRSKTLADYPFFWWLISIAALTITTLTFVISRARLHKRNSDKLLRKNAANTLLISALDEMVAAVIIFDLDFNVVHWNRGYEAAFPDLLPHLDAGTNMKKVLSHSFTAQQASSDDKFASVDDIVASVKAGKSRPRTIQTPQGEVFEAREFRLGTDHYASVCVNITRLHDQQDTIRAQANRLEVMNDQLKAFSAIAAHDLTAALQQQNTLLTFIIEDLADAKLTLPTDIQENFDLVKELSERMAHLIEDLLIYARTETDIALGSVPNPSERLREVVKLVATNNGFIIDIADQMPAMKINPTVFDTIMRNLISNAVKHHDRLEGKISVAARLQESLVEISITDDGPGIPEKFQDTIFQPFKRLSSDVSGSGLGLAFVCKSLEQIGGTIRVENLAPRGSRFVASLPVYPDDPISFSQVV